MALHYSKQWDYPFHPLCKFLVFDSLCDTKKTISAKQIDWDSTNRHLLDPERCIDKIAKSDVIYGHTVYQKNFHDAMTIERGRLMM